MKKNVGNKRVLVAMSGGVDSSVSAALLQEQGYDVVGVSMQVWDHSSAEEAGSGSCCSLDDIHDARRVAGQLGIPFYVVNYEEEFRRLVVDDFVSEYRQGRTPNPCIRCNERVKFDLLLRKAGELEADFLATGHYARIVRDEAGSHLLKGLDRNKDQSYFLFTLTQRQLSRVLFPVGGMSKPEVREAAQRFALRVAEKGESQEICFIPHDDYIRFLEEERIDDLSGEIVTSTGEAVGRHSGTYRYTVGQRKGLGIAWTEPLYVTAIDAAKRQVVVGPVGDLLRVGLVASGVTWTSATPGKMFRAECRIRYRHAAVPCTVETDGSRMRVLFDRPEKGVTPGQAAVIYRGDELLGGGWIDTPLPSCEPEPTCRS